MDRHDSQHAERFGFLQCDPLRHQFSEYKVKEHEHQSHTVVRELYGIPALYSHSASTGEMPAAADADE